MSFVRIENAVKRADELISQNQTPIALKTLVQILTNRKQMRHGWSPVLEGIVIKTLECCVELRQKLARDVITLYRNVCSTPQAGGGPGTSATVVHLDSLERVIRVFLECAESRLKLAVSSSSAASAAAPAETTAAQDEQQPDPERDIMEQLSQQDSSFAGASPITSNKDVLGPWIRFYWESLRTVLDIAKNNAKMENIYHETMLRALEFCSSYNRISEFRHLCELLRFHLSSLLRFTQNHISQLMQSLPPQSTTMADGDKNEADHQVISVYLAQRMSCLDPTTWCRMVHERIAMMRVALDLDIDQEAFRILEELNSLQSLTRLSGSSTTVSTAPSPSGTPAPSVVSSNRISNWLLYQLRNTSFSVYCGNFLPDSSALISTQTTTTGFCTLNHPILMMDMWNKIGLLMKRVKNWALLAYSEWKFLQILVSSHSPAVINQPENISKVQRITANVIFSLLCIPCSAGGSSSDVLSGESFVPTSSRDKSLRLAHVLGLAEAPKPEMLLSELFRLSTTSVITIMPELCDLVSILASPSAMLPAADTEDPWKMPRRVAAILKQLFDGSASSTPMMAEDEFNKFFGSPIRRNAVWNFVDTIARLYKAVRLDAVLDVLAPVLLSSSGTVEADETGRASLQIEFEKLVLGTFGGRFSSNGEKAIDIDHVRNIIHFRYHKELSTEVNTKQIVALGLSLENVIRKIPTVAVPPVSPVAAQPATVAVEAQPAAPAVDAEGAVQLKSKIQTMIRREKEEHDRLLRRRKEIEDRRVMEEKKQLEEKQKEEARIRREQEIKEKQEAERLVKEMEKRKKEQEKKEAELAKIAQAKAVVEEVEKKTGKKTKLSQKIEQNPELLTKLDENKLIEETLAEKQKEIEEHEKKLLTMEKNVSFLERARREREYPYLRQQIQRQVEEDRLWFDRQVEQANVAHRRAYDERLAVKKQLMKFKPEKSQFVSTVMERRKETLSKEKQEWEQRREAKRTEFVKEREQLQEQLEGLNRQIADIRASMEKEKKRKQEEERKRKQEEADKATAERKAKEEAEATLHRQADIQRKKQEEIERKLEGGKYRPPGARGRDDDRDRFGDRRDDRDRFGDRDRDRDRRDEDRDRGSRDGSRKKSPSPPPKATPGKYVPPSRRR